MFLSAFTVKVSYEGIFSFINDRKYHSINVNASVVSNVVRRHCFPFIVKLELARKFYVRISSIVCIFIRRDTRTKSIRSKSVVVESNAARIRATKISLQLDGITKKKRIFTYVNSIVRPRRRVPAPVHRKISGNGHSFHSRDEFAAVRALAKDSPTSRPENRLETRTDRVFHISLRKPRTFTDVTRKRLAVFPYCFSRLISLHFFKGNISTAYE